jgi:alkylation response protein AidB-like acyl-CoA dehydrogenase
MDLGIPSTLKSEQQAFTDFVNEQVQPHLATWRREGMIARSLFQTMGQAGWYGFKIEKGHLVKTTALREALLMEILAAVAPGVAIAILAHIDLGFLGLFLFGHPGLKQRYAEDVLKGRRLMCLGNTENIAGSDVAGIGMQATKEDGGWRLNGAKAFVTNGAIADLGVITAVTAPDAPRNRRLSMFLVDLNTEGVRRQKLNKRVWIPSDLTRLTLKDVFVADDHLLGDLGQGLQQVLAIFTRSRLTISALTLGTGRGAFDLAIAHAQRRKAFGKPLMDFQAKAFEAATHHAALEAARLALYKACWCWDQKQDYQMEASVAKYLSVKAAQEVSTWAADLFGAASVMADHPIHDYPLDVWASSLGEGTQDVQKLVIIRELLKRRDQGRI